MTEISETSRPLEDLLDQESPEKFFDPEALRLLEACFNEKDIESLGTIRLAQRLNDQWFMVIGSKGLYTFLPHEYPENSGNYLRFLNTGFFDRKTMQLKFGVELDSAVNLPSKDVVFIGDGGENITRETIENNGKVTGFICNRFTVSKGDDGKWHFTGKEEADKRFSPARAYLDKKNGHEFKYKPNVEAGSKIGRAHV